MFVYLFVGESAYHYNYNNMTQSAGATVAEQRDYDDDDGWPVCEKVLRSLSEDVRPVATVNSDNNDAAASAAAVVTNVQSCLSEPVVPVPVERPPQRRRRLPERERRTHLWRPPSKRCRDVQTAAARRTQTRLMAVRSAYADGKYYAPGAPHVSRTVEELSLWPADETPDNENTYTAGTVLYDRDTGACYLHGFANPRSRVAVDCDRLTATLPRHGSTVKAYSALRIPPEDRAEGAAPILVLHHFQVFSCAALFK